MIVMAGEFGRTPKVFTFPGAISKLPGRDHWGAVQTVFFGARGSQTFPGFAVLDASVNYSIPVLRTLRPWVKLDIFNLFNNEKLIAWNTTVSQNRAAGVDNLGLATSFTPGPAFGTATGNTQTNLNVNNINTYPLAYNGAAPGGRTFQVAVGFRF